MTTAQVANSPIWKFFDNSGKPLSYGLVYSYAAGTLTPQATYPSSSEATPNTNPVVLNFRGECALWFDPSSSYKINVTDQFGNQIPGWPQDNIQGALATSNLGNLIPATSNTYTLGSPASSWAQLYLGPNNAPVLDTNSGNIGYYAQTSGEVYANVIPPSLAYPPSRGFTLNVWRFFTAAQIASCINEDGLVDMTAAIQAANNYLEGNITPAAGGQPHPGGTLYFPTGNYNITGNVRVGGHVIWKGDEYRNSILSWNSSTYTGVGVSLGPDLSGFFGYNGLYTFGSAITDMRLSPAANNQMSVMIQGIGAAQFCYLKRVEIDNVNQFAVDLSGAGGPAYFYCEDIDISGGTSASVSDREGFRISMGGGYCSLSKVSIEGSAGQNFNIAVRASSDSSDGAQLLIDNFHTENTTTGIYFDTGGTNAISTINGYSGSATTGTLISIPNGYTGTVNCISINGLTGSAGQPIAIANANTGESLTNWMGNYNWSGVPGVQSGSFAATIIHNTPHIRYGKSMTQSLAQNVLTLITYPVKVDDWQTTSEWSGSRYTPIVQGRYKVSCSISVASATWSAGELFEIAILKNGATFSINSDTTGVGTFIRQIEHDDTVFLNGVGDYIEIWAIQNSGSSTLNTDSNTFDCYVTIDKL